MVGAAGLLIACIAVSIRHPVSQTFLLLAFGLVWYSVWDTARHSFPAGVNDHAARLLRLTRLGLLSAGIVWGALAGTYVMLNRRYEIARVNTNQIAPLFLQNDELILRRLDRPLSRLQRGDVVIHWRNAPQLTIVERVLGLPGDRIEFGRAGLRVNGSRLTAKGQPLSPTPAVPFAVTVPAGCVGLWRPGGGSGDTSLLMLPESAIDGRVVAVFRPLERRRWLGRL